MCEISAELLLEIRSRFALVDTCPEQGKRVFFENAGGALTLNSVVQTSAESAAIPDNQGRDNSMSASLVNKIALAKSDMATFFNAPSGQFFVGESGTELLFRLISSACLAIRATGGTVLGSSLEHPASRSAAIRWAEIAGLDYVSVPHNSATGTVDAADYAALVTENTRVATILHTSPVTGMAVDVGAVSRAIRAVAPDCYIVVDGIQHAAHGQLDLADYGVDGYVVSPYKMFSRHGYGVAWISHRFADLPHDTLIGGPGRNWELGTRDTGAYATFSDVVAYFDWLGTQVSSEPDRRARIQAAGQAIHAHEHVLCETLLHGAGNLAGLADLPDVEILGGVDNPAREGLVSFAIRGRPSQDIVSELRMRGIRVHVRKADHYSANILTPLGMDDCIRVSFCHYNSQAEVMDFLAAMAEISGN